MSIEALVCTDKKTDPLTIRVNGREPTFTVATDLIMAKAVAQLEERLLDLLDIAAVVFAADGTFKRGDATRPQMGKDWRRTLDFTIPVRVPQFWSTPHVVHALVDAVSFMTEDSVDFHFVQREPTLPAQSFFSFDSRSATFEAEEVVLFSGGLDSYAGALEALSTTSSKIILLTHRSSQKAIPHQVKLGKYLAEKFEGRVLHIHVPAHRVGEAASESTQRSRAFLFAALGQVVAQAFAAKRLNFYENGIISHNLPLSRQIVGSMASRTTHPLTLTKLNRLMDLVVPKTISIENRYQWLTKAEVVGRIQTFNGADQLALTISCTNNRDRNKLQTHCGNCSQCLDRRFAILANGLEIHEPEEIYATDVLLGTRETPRSRTMALEWTRHAMALAGMEGRQFIGSFGTELARVARGHEGLQSTEVLKRSHEMHRRHGQTIREVLLKAVQAIAPKLVDHLLPNSSLLRMFLVDARSTAQPCVGVAELVHAPTETLEDFGDDWSVTDPEYCLRVRFLEKNGKPVVAVDLAPNSYPVLSSL